MFRSQSGPGGLTINTASANSLSSSSSNNQSNLAPPSANVPSKPLFGSTTATTQPQPSTSLFGNTQAQNPINQQSTGGLFGNQPNSTTSGLFGSQQPQQKPANIFGLGNSVQQSQPQNSGSLFGSNPSQSNAQQPTGSLFGNMYSNQNASSTMGNNPSVATSQSQNLRIPQTSLFSSTIGQHTQQQQPVPGVRISVNELRPTTRFNDLHEELQKAIEYVDNFIVNQMQWQEQCQLSNSKLHDMTVQIPPDVEFCSKQLETMQNALENDAGSIEYAKRLVKTDASDAKLSFQTIQTLKLPTQIQQSNIWSTNAAPQVSVSEFSDTEADGASNRSIVDYFSKQADIMSRALEDCKRNLTEVEVYLGGLESNVIQQTHQASGARGQEISGNSAEDQVRELAAVLRAFENGILGVAANVGAAREIVQDTMLGSGDSIAPKTSTRRFGTL